jgi:hypothetical protein
VEHPLLFSDRRKVLPKINAINKNLKKNMLKEQACQFKIKKLNTNAEKDGQEDLYEGRFCKT